MSNEAITPPPAGRNGKRITPLAVATLERSSDPADTSEADTELQEQTRPPMDPDSSPAAQHRRDVNLRLVKPR